MTDTLTRIAAVVDTNRHDAAHYVTGYADNLTTILEKSQQ